jgi:hypothetical protein
VGEPRTAGTVLVVDWWGHFKLAQSTNRLRPLSHWIRRRLRCLVWTQWKNRKTRVRELLRRGCLATTP